MAQVKVPANVSSITLTTSGVTAPSSGVITCTAAEATILCKAESWGPGTKPVQSSVLATGVPDIFMPSVVTSITINGNVYAVSSGKIASVPVADATNFFMTNKQGFAPFLLVTG